MKWVPDKRENTGRGSWLIAQARLDELWEGVEAGDRSCTYWYLWLLRLAGRIEPMRRQVEAGAYRAAEMVIGFHTRRGDLAELQSIVEAGYEGAARELAWVARNLGDADVLRELAATGDSWATYLLAMVDAGTWRGEDELLQFYRERGTVDGLRRRAAASYKAREALIATLAEQKAVDELWELAREGHGQYRLAVLLGKRRDLDGLRELAALDKVQLGRANPVEPARRRHAAGRGHPARARGTGHASGSQGRHGGAAGL